MEQVDISNTSVFCLVRIVFLARQGEVFPVKRLAVAQPEVARVHRQHGIACLDGWCQVEVDLLEVANFIQTNARGIDIQRIALDLIAVIILYLFVVTRSPDFRTSKISIELAVLFIAKIDNIAIRRTRKIARVARIDLVVVVQCAARDGDGVARHISCYAVHTAAANDAATRSKRAAVDIDNIPCGPAAPRSGKSAPYIAQISAGDSDRIPLCTARCPRGRSTDQRGRRAAVERDLIPRCRSHSNAAVNCAMSRCGRLDAVNRHNIARRICCGIGTGNIATDDRMIAATLRADRDRIVARITADHVAALILAHTDDDIRRIRR